MRRSRYEVLTKIATGGMATVYVARARGAVGFSRLVAVKRPHPFVTGDPDLVRQLEAEARVASMIHHPNVVSVLDVEELEGEVVLVMDYVEGCTLRMLVDHTPSAGSARMAVRVVLDVAAGLHAAHRLRDGSGVLLGVVHRDVSPQNVLVGLDGVARLTDFGIAKIANAEGDPTSNDIMKGKLAYLAPEYIATRRFEPRSDLFALAIVAWEALAGERLFKGATDVETLLKIIDARVPLLGTVRPELAPLESVIATALARAPEDRQESVLAFATALEEAARGSIGVATHDEVGALVESAAGERIAERRRVLETSPATSLAAAAPPVPKTARDEMDTASLAPPALDTPPPRPRSRPWRGILAALAIALLAGALVFARHRPEAATASVTEVSDAAPVLASSAAEPAASASADPEETASATPRNLGSHRGQRTVRTPARASASPLPVHAPPNPYAK